MKYSKKLIAWAALPEKRRHALILKWNKEDNQRELRSYQKLAFEACEGLREYIANAPEVTSVGVLAGQLLEVGPTGLISEIGLNVNTRLHGDKRSEQIPMWYAGFPVKQVNYGDLRDTYLRTWKRLFKELRGWSEAQTLAWAERWQEQLIGADDPIIYNEGAIEVAIPCLIEDQVKEAAGFHKQELFLDIRRIIEGRGDGTESTTPHPDLVKGYDWKRVRREIKKLTDQALKKKNPKNE